MLNKSSAIRLKAEWEEQRAILLSFPHKHSDWQDLLQSARKCFVRIIKCIAKFESVYVCVDPRDKKGLELVQKSCKKELRAGNVQIFRVYSNDIWARDFGAISIQKNGANTLLDFGFNGWGLKFRANFDNQTNRALYKLGVFENLLTQDLILEGGSIDSNGCGLLLTTSQCLLEANRNPHLSKQEIHSRLLKIFGLKKVLWLENGSLCGDDTDSHIDNLARFIAPKTIAYAKCEDKLDVNFKPLEAMERELFALRDENDKPFRLIALPLPKARFYKGERLPASYVNFLFVNNALLVPTYKDKKSDKKALQILSDELPHLKVLGIDCTTLIKWHGSIHCASMQLY